MELVHLARFVYVGGMTAAFDTDETYPVLL